MEDKRQKKGYYFEIFDCFTCGETTSAAVDFLKNKPQIKKYNKKNMRITF